MPTKRSMLAAGMTEAEISQAQAKVLCYVCSKEVVGLAQRDDGFEQATAVSLPDGTQAIIQPTPPGVKLGTRHRGCAPSEFAVKSVKCWISGRVHIADEGLITE